MKRAMIAWMFALLVPALLAAGPVIKFKSTSLDFGEAESGKVVEISFEFENAGNSPLVLKNVLPACGCSTAEMKKMTYNPGEKGVIPVKFNTSGYSGKVQKLVTVTTNDTANAEVRLLFSGNVTLKDFAQGEASSDHLAFGKVLAGKSYTRKVTLTNSGTIDLRIVEACGAPETSLSFSHRLVPPRKSAEITVTFTPFERGTFSTLVKVRTTDYKRAYLFLRVDAEVE